VLVLARHTHQAEHARAFGADGVISARGDFYPAVAQALGASLLKPIIGKRVVIGGADVVFECVGGDDSIDDALRFTRAGGRVVLVGLAATPRGIDWTSIWLKELRLQGMYTFSHEEWQGEKWHAFDLALKLMRERKWNLGHLITHKFKLEEYPRAFEVMQHRARHRAVRVVFEF
jgi:threonine dehydrogenase-like Zn-dependent dehydrogenase